MITIYFVGGRTNWNDALQMALNEHFQDFGGDRQEADNIVIFIADGPSTVDTGLTEAIVQNFLASDKVDRVITFTLRMSSTWLILLYILFAKYTC